MKSTLCALYVFASLFAAAQNLPTTVALIDVSNPPQSFVAFSGSMAFSETGRSGQMVETQSGTAQGRNISQKSIVTVLATFTWAGAQGFGAEHVNRHDHFFSAADTAPGSIIDFPPQKLEVPIDSSMKGPGPPLTYTVDVHFIQFSDGSTWGQSTIAAELKLQRADITSYYQNLLTVYATANLPAFTEAVNTVSVPREHQHFSTAMGEHKRLQMVLAQDGAQAAVNLIKERLANAAAHRAKGDF